jgi:cytochrome c
VPPPKPVVVATASGGAADVKALLGANACLACHGIKSKIVGPGFNEVLAKHKGRADLEAYLLEKIKGGGVGVYGSVPMPAQPQLSDADARAMARWIAAGAP